MVIRKETIAVLIIYLLGLVQGIAFTTVPAMANFLTSQSGFGFTLSQYGTLFTPMIFGAIAASFFGGLLAKKFSVKTLLLICILLNVIALSLIGLSHIHLRNQLFTYPIFLAAMGLLGAGFGGTITALNPFAVHFFPNHSSSALTALHSCLGIGTAIGPLSLSLFQSENIWWFDPALIAALFFFLLISALFSLPKNASIEISDSKETSGSPHLIWIFAFIALLYGITETTFGNWTTIFLHHEKKLSEIDANLALSFFWASVTIGRIFVTVLSLKIKARIIFSILPFIIMASIIFIQSIASSTSALLAFSLAGFGCSAFLPLTVDFGVSNHLKNTSFASGLIIATYMIGYGIASQGVGILHKSHAISFHTIYNILFALVIILAFFCLVSTKSNQKKRRP